MRPGSDRLRLATRCACTGQLAYASLLAVLSYPASTFGQAPAPTGGSTLTDTRRADTSTTSRAPARRGGTVPSPPLAFADSEPDIPTEEKLRERFEARVRYARVGDLANADLELEVVEELRRALGVKNVIIVSAELISEARAATAADDSARALMLADAAVRISPDLISAQWVHIEALVNQDPPPIQAILAAWFHLVATKVGTFRNAVVFWADLFASIGLALLLSILVFVGVQLTKYLRYPAHDLARMFPSLLGDGEMVLLLVVVLAAPWALGLGLATTVLLALALLMAYQATLERGLSIAMATLVAAGPGLVALAAPLVTFHGSSSDAMATALSEAFSLEAEERLEKQASREGSKDYDTTMILAHRGRQRGDLEDAAREYEAALTARPTSAVARNNLGTIYYLLGKEEAARSAFRQANEGEGLAEASLNLASIVLDDGNFDEASRYLDRARAQRPELAAAYTKLDGGLPTMKKLIDAPIDPSFLWGHLLSPDWSTCWSIAEQLWGPLGGRAPAWSTPLAGAIAFGLAFLLYKRRLKLSTGCAKCGVPASRSSPAYLCEPCRSVFLLAVIVEPEMRMRKEREVRRHQRARRALGRLWSLFAGGGHVLGERPAWGVVLSFVVALGFVTAGFAHGFATHPWPILPDNVSDQLAMWVSYAVAGITTLVSVVQSWER